MKERAFYEKTNWLVIIAGVVVGLAALLLQKLGNPGNMGFKNAPTQVAVLVDDPCAVENIQRFAHHNGYQFTAVENGSEWMLTLHK